MEGRQLWIVFFSFCGWFCLWTVFAVCCLRQSFSGIETVNVLGPPSAAALIMTLLGSRLPCNNDNTMNRDRSSGENVDLKDCPCMPILFSPALVQLILTLAGCERSRWTSGPSQTVPILMASSSRLT